MLDPADGRTNTNLPRSSKDAARQHAAVERDTAAQRQHSTPPLYDTLLLTDVPVLPLPLPFDHLLRSRLCVTRCPSDLRFSEYEHANLVYWSGQLVELVVRVNNTYTCVKEA